MWHWRPSSTSWPGVVWDKSAAKLAIVPLGRKSAASLPSRNAAFSSRARTVGSSPKTSSPTAARAMASRIASVGWVTVSLRRSMTGSVSSCMSIISDDEHDRPATEEVVFLQLPADALRVGHADNHAGAERIVHDAHRLHKQRRNERVSLVDRQAHVAHGLLRIVFVAHQAASDDDAGVGVDAGVHHVAAFIDNPRRHAPPHAQPAGVNDETRVHVPVFAQEGL